MKSNRKGQSIIGVLVTASIMAIVMMAFMTMSRQQGKATRQIAAWGGVNDLGHSLDLLFGNPLCATTGNYRNGGAVATVTLGAGTYSLVADTLQFSNGTLAITSLQNATISQMLTPYSVNAMTFTGLGGNTATQYPFAMNVTFSAPNNSPPPAPLSKFVMVYTDAARRVIGACTMVTTGVRPTIMQTFSTAGATSWTPPAGVTIVKARVVGGGGGGAAATLQQSGGGGGAGGYCEGYFNVVAGTPVPIVVGAAGTAGVYAAAWNAGVDGGNGGLSRFGAFCRGNGGQGGAAQPGGAGGGRGGQGFLGAGVNGLVAEGGNGTDGTTGPAFAYCNSPSCMGGSGGASALGGGGRSGTAGGGGRPAAAPGSGGGGCYSGVTPGPGGRGADGIVILEY